MVAVVWKLLSAEELAKLADADGHADLPLGRIGVSLLVITLGLWLIRTFARMFLSNWHLAADASERVVMVQTYLALLQEGSGLDTSDRELIITALFRKASTGIVRDDANPPMLVSQLVRKGE